MSDVRASVSVPVTARFAGIATPSPSTPVVVDSNTGFLYTLKTGDTVVQCGWGGNIVYDGTNLVIEKTSGLGIKVDTTTPTFPWRDIEGLLYPDATAGPVRGTFITGVSAFSYANNKQMDFSFHMPHDWAPGTDLYIHVHWAHNADTTATGNVVFNFSVSYAKGHNQANFSAAVAPSITYALTNIATTPRYRHRIDEIQVSAATPSGTQLDTDNIEPDGLIQGTITVDLSGATLTTTSPVNSIYIFTIDLHYQSSGIGTKNKAPNFYS